MSASSTIGNLQSALNCAGKCDCCDKLQSQINNLKEEIARIPRVDEARIVQTTRSALQPDITTAVAAGGAVIVNKLQPQISDSFEKAKAALERAFNADKKADYSAQEAIAAKREAEVAKVAANQAKYVASAADITAHNAVNSAGTATNVANRADDAAFKAQNDAFVADRKAGNSLDIARKAALESDLAKGIANQADFKAGKAINDAGTAVSKAAQASKEAIDATNTVGGLRGIINGIGAKVDGFGKAIAKLEQSVGEAITKAARAIGISETALAATGKLFLKIAEIFNIIGTFAVLFEQILTLNVLGGRIDAIESGLIALGASVSGILGKLLGLQNRITRNEATIGEVRGIAVDAKGISEGAQRLAGQAIQDAAGAQTTANTASSKAINAQTTADGAVRNANQANENAKTAYQKAAEAQLTANTATTIANQATTTANRATNKAGEAFNKAVEALGVALTVLALVQAVRGLRGLAGAPGLPGRQGIPGNRGLTGGQGVPGIPGSAGAPGITQIIQQPGTPGRDGRNGLSGITGRPGINGLPGRNGVDAVPYNDAALRAFIAGQHTTTRSTNVVQHAQTRTTILTPIMAALAPILALLKQIYDIVSKAASAAQLALLNIINSKLGVQVTGGISGLVTAVAKNTYIDKALGILTFAATMHNALMLSNNLGQTLGTIIDQVLGFILPKGLDGTPISINQVIGKAVHEILADTIGEANYKEISQDWAKANRIYQASVNVFNQVGNAVGLVTAGMEVIGGNIGKIGNALKVWGVLGEKAYGWMNPQPNMKGRFFNFINTATAEANTIAMMVAIPIGISAAAIEINNSVGAVKKELDQEDPKDKDGNPVHDKLGNIIKYQPGVTVPEPQKTITAQLQAQADSTNLIAATLEDIFDGGD
ncbi:alanine-zipper protein [Nostoc sp.]|uniref:alanine-zipper protein n=1 Tax=Nostoc sp. TaxID=1180 RepID=UPI002FFD3279